MRGVRTNEGEGGTPDTLLFNRCVTATDTAGEKAKEVVIPEEEEAMVEKAAAY